MDHKIQLYQSLEKEFSKRGYLLYLVGGTVRDYLLNKELTDMDLVTDATPSEMKEFLLGDYTFERFGSVKVKKESTKFDITTLRKESGYLDNRHPNKIIFTKDIKEDVCRRDITINALYMDKDLKVIDLVNGVNDLKDKVIRMIGDPQKRIEEDPLRIIRIYRFQIETGFNIDSSLNEALEKNFDKVSLLNKDKIRQEISKCSEKEKLVEILNSHHIIIDK